MGLFDKVEHFKGQSYERLKRDCKSGGVLFTDPEFPANKSSLGTSSKFDGIDWKRPGDLSNDPHLFVDGINIHDVRQGGLGDCWFVSAMAVVASKKGYWEKVIPNCKEQDWDPKKPEEYAGIFKFRFWRFGKWIEVVIDDLLPTRRGQLIYVSSATENEFWSALLEKAYAKLFGSYEALIAGFAEEALVDFTGGVPEILRDLTEYLSSEEEKNNLFKFLERESHQGSLLCASIKSMEGETEGRLNNGLISTHAYSVTSVREVATKGTGLFNMFNKEKLYLVRLRNPWGAKEWNGAFSDGSPEWDRISKSEQKSMGLTFDDDGEFWMSFDDFVSNYHTLTILRLVNTSVFSLRKTWYEASMKSTFAPAVNDKPGALVNPQMAINIPTSEDEILIDVIQDVPRGEELPFGFMVLQVEVGRRTRLNTLDWADVVDEFVMNGARSLSKRSKVSRGYFLIVPFLLKDPTQGSGGVEFIVRVYTSNENQARVLPAELAKPRCNILCCAKPPVSVITRITMVKAKGLDPSIEGGKPDPYCVVKCENKVFHTESKKDTVDPNWSEDFLFYRRHPENNPISISIFNANPMFDDFMGQCSIPFDNSFSSTIPLLKFKLQGKDPQKKPEMPGQLYVRIWNGRSMDQL